MMYCPKTNIVHNIFHAPLSFPSKDRFPILSSRNCLQCKQTLCLCIIPYVKWNYSWKFWYGIDKKLFNQNCLPNQPAGIWTSIKMVYDIEVYYVKYLSEHNKLVIWLLYWKILRIQFSPKIIWICLSGVAVNVYTNYNLHS